MRDYLQRFLNRAREVNENDVQDIRHDFLQFNVSHLDPPWEGQTPLEGGLAHRAKFFSGPLTLDP